MSSTTKAEVVFAMAMACVLGAVVLGISVWAQPPQPPLAGVEWYCVRAEPAPGLPAARVEKAWVAILQHAHHLRVSRCEDVEPLLLDGPIGLVHVRTNYRRLTAVYVQGELAVDVGLAGRAPTMTWVTDIGPLPAAQLTHHIPDWSRWAIDQVLVAFFQQPGARWALEE